MLYPSVTTLCSAAFASLLLVGAPGSRSCTSTAGSSEARFARVDTVSSSAFAIDRDDAGPGLTRAVAAAAAAHECLRIEPGTYTLREPVVLPSFGNVYARGDVILEVIDGARFAHVRIPPNRSDVRVVGLTFRGNRGDFDPEVPVDLSYRNRAVEVRRAKRVEIRNCTFVDQLHMCLWVVESDDVDIVGNRFRRTGLGGLPKAKGKGGTRYNYDQLFIGGSARGCTRVRVLDNAFSDVGYGLPWSGGPDADAIQVFDADDAATRTTDLLIAGNTFDSVATRCIKLQSGRRVRIADNDFATSMAGVSFASSYGTEDVAIVGNRVVGLRRFVSIGGLASFLKAGQQYIRYTDTRIDSNVVRRTRYFVRAGDAGFVDGGRIEYNRFLEPQPSDFHFSLRGADWTFAHNEFHARQTGEYPFRIIDGSDRYAVRDNTFSVSASAKGRNTFMRGYNRHAREVDYSDNRFTIPGMNDTRYLLDAVRGSRSRPDTTTHVLRGNLLNRSVHVPGSEYQTTRPHDGYWAAGTFVRNADDSSPYGWYCTESGRPGTWVDVADEGQLERLR